MDWTSYDSYNEQGGGLTYEDFDTDCGDDGEECTLEEVEADYNESIIEDIFVSSSCGEVNYRVLCDNWMK